MGISEAARRIQTLCEEFVKQVASKYKGDNNTKHTVAVMLFALVEANATFGEDDAKDAEDEIDVSSASELDLEFINSIKEQCQRCMAEITFCVAASSTVLQQKRSELTKQEIFVRMQQSRDETVEAIRETLAVEHAERVESLADFVRRASDQVQAVRGVAEELSRRQQAMREEVARAEARQAERDRRVLDGIEEIRDILAGQQLGGARPASSSSGLPLASSRAEELMGRLRRFAALTKKQVQQAAERGERKPPGVLCKPSEKLGGGGQATVMQGVQVRYDGAEVEVAVKRFRVDPARPWEAERALVEAYLMQTATSTREGQRHVLRCSGVAYREVKNEDEEVEHHLLLVLELAPDGSVHDALHGDGVRKEWVLDRVEGWMLGLVAALEFVHDAMSVAHCDVKPANLLLCDHAFRVKLADLGSAYQPRPDHALTMRAATTRGAGHTEAYAAPEQLRGEPPSTQVDVWAGAMTIFEMGSGRGPWQSRPSLAAIEAGLRPDTAAPSRWTGAPLDPALVAVLETCWNLLPSRRPTAPELGRQMKAILHVTAHTSQLPPPLPHSMWCMSVGCEGSVCDSMWWMSVGCEG